MQIEAQQHSDARPARRWPRRVAAVAAAAIVAAFILSPPWSVLDKADVFGYATCHRISDRSFHLGRQLPLCARCTGTYLGVLTAFGAFWLRGRRRAAGFPPARVLAALVGFWAIWGADGLNSYLVLLGVAHLYEPHQLLRVLTGCLNGVALGALVWPVFNFALWKESAPRRVVEGWRELGWMVVVAWAAALVVYTEPAFLLYPVALVSALGVLLMLTLVNAILVLVVTRQEASAVTWRDAALPMLVGLALALVEVGIIDFVRLNFLPPLQF